MSDIVRGAVAEVIATALMTFAISLGKRFWLLFTPAPLQVTSAD